MLCVVSEDTDRVIGERRMSTLRDLGSDPSVVRTEEQMLAFAARQLGRNARPAVLPDLPVRRRRWPGWLAALSGVPDGHPAARPC